MVLPVRAKRLLTLLDRADGHPVDFATIERVLWPSPRRPPRGAQNMMRMSVMDIRRAFRNQGEDSGVYAVRDYGYVRLRNGHGD